LASIIEIIVVYYLQKGIAPPFPMGFSEGPSGVGTMEQN